MYIRLYSVIRFSLRFAPTPSWLLGDHDQLLQSKIERCLVTI